MTVDRNVELGYDFEEEESETEMARLFFIDGTKCWLPKSQIVEEDADNNTVTIPEWLAIDNGLV